MSSVDARVLALTEDVIGLTDLNEFRHGLLDALRHHIPSEIAALNDLGPDPGDAIALVRPATVPADLMETFARLKHQHPIAAYHARTHDGRAYRFSDLISTRELHRLELYQQLYKPLGIRHQIAFTLPTAPQRLLAVALSRAQRDYTNTERQLLNRARPLLIQAFRNAIEHHQLAMSLTRLRDGTAMIEHLHELGLTDREAQIIHLLAHGTSTRDIATQLNISQRTVAKHLERCFHKLDVTSQSAAANKAWAPA